jgi:hypothetical protein
MFSALADYVKLSAASVTTRLTGMVAIALPFMIAATFGLAAIYIAISNAYGDLTAAIVLTIAFVVLGLIMAGVVAAQRRRQETLKEEALMHARRSFGASALMATNPALLLGAGRVVYRVVRQAPLLTILPIAAGFIFAVTRSSSAKAQADDAR